MNQRSSNNNNEEEERQTFSIPTFRPQKETKEIDLATLTEEQFQALRKSDPFLYYSIPAVMQARRVGKTIGYADVLSSLQGDVDAGAGGSTSRRRTRVTRKTRISDGCDDVTALSAIFDQLDCDVLLSKSD